MKHVSKFLALILLCAVTASGGAFLEFFNGSSDGDNVTLEWKTRAESNLLRYEVQRKAGSNGDFITLASVSPKGSNSAYSYVDRSAYKDAGSLYIYRLKIVEASGTPASYSNEVSITHSVNSVKRTWGSIKAMFR
jgi:hypothetical protein